MFKGTTIVCVRRNDMVAMAGDGQVTLGNQIIKAGAKKVRRLHKGTVLAGFAGSTADALTLLERFESRLEENSGDLMRSAVSLVKEWRTDRALRRLEALMIVADSGLTLMLSGAGDILEPENNVAAIGSGSGYAQAAALDFAGVRLRDGRRITVTKDWNGGTAEARFLRRIRDDACRIFGTTLSPDYNAVHYDHLHLEATDTRFCR